VRLHTDSSAAASAKALNARAYTLGTDVVFGAGQFSPETSAGKHLLAHELVHVVQQRGHRYATQQVKPIRNADDAEIQTKERSAIRVMPAQCTKGLSPLAAPTVQRQPVPSGGKQQAKRVLTRGEEIRLSFTSPGEIALVLNPPMLSLYNFAIDKPALKKEHLAALQLLASLIRQFPGGKLSAAVKGHADSTGDDTTINQPLSEKRALSVQKTLQSAAGVPVAFSYCGELCPMATNDTVEGRSRNRRVDITLSSGYKVDHIDWPSLCDLVPEICLCLANPASCREEDGDGIHWPSLCSGELGKLICVGTLCLAFRICLITFCRVFPELCLATLCAVFPSLCRHKPKPPQKRKKERPCVVSVKFPPERPVIKATNLPSSAFGPCMMSGFSMRVVFKDDDTGCTCRLGEYKQELRGFAERDGGTGVMKPADPPGLKLDRSVYQEDLRESVWHYGIRSEKIGNTDKDQFLPDRETGCEYKGADDPGMNNGVPGEHMRFHFEFRGAPVHRNDRDILLRPWSKWTVEGDYTVPKGPGPGGKPGSGGTQKVVRATSRKAKGSPTKSYGSYYGGGIDPKAKVGEEYDMSIDFRVRGRSEIFTYEVHVKVTQADDQSVTVVTSNADDLNLAPPNTPEIVLKAHKTLTLSRNIL
jgi:outer membrane protein OmpA-like peptidoglycan-associated protein